MTVFVLDDEKPILRGEEAVLRAALPEAEILPFSLARDALNAVSEGKDPDAVFCDIEMPGMNGLAFAAEIRKRSPRTRIIFVTGYPQYALEAYRLHASGYVTKPLDAARVREEMEAVNIPFRFKSGKLQVRCLGEFEVFWNGKPLMFARRKTGELLAFLIDREGGLCTAEEIISALWEGTEDMRAGKARLRVLIADLKNTLGKIGMGEALIRRSGRLAISRDAVDCDYYRMLEGDPSAVNAYHGEYMSQFSWAEITAGKLYFRSPGGKV